MLKKRKKLFFIRNVALGEIGLIILSMISFSIILSDINIVSAYVNPTDAAPKTGSSGLGFISEAFGGELFLKGEGDKLIAKGIPAHIISAALYAVVAGGITYMIAGMVGASDEEAKAAAFAVALGTGIARFGNFNSSYMFWFCKLVYYNWVGSYSCKHN